MSVITTPSGYRVEIKDEVTYGDERAVRRAMQQSMRVSSQGNPQKKKEASAVIQGSAFLMDGQDELARRVIISIHKSDGTQEIGDPIDTISKWSRSDGRAVFDAIEKIFEKITEIQDPESPEKKA